MISQYRDKEKMKKTAKNFKDKEGATFSKK
jgi:hypothetical protein